MGSLYLNRLSREDYQQLVVNLWESQRGNCFICEQPIDLDLHASTIDVDHVVPSTAGGKDDPTNFALAHQSCNRSKQASDLHVARLLYRFTCIGQTVAGQPGRPNLGDVLQSVGGARFEIPVRISGDTVTYSFPDLEAPQLISTALHIDQLSGMHYFFAVVPIAYIAHDDRMGPRAIAGDSLRRLVEEFYSRLPQLQVGLAWLSHTDAQARFPIKVFDGQHKIAAQVLLGVREIPLRIFVNPDPETLLTANTHAGTSLHQVAFDKSVQRRLGSQLYTDRIERYLAETGRPADFRGFSEYDLISHFKGKWREVRRYILDDVRDAITHNPQNRLKSYIDFGGRGSELPLSYSTIEKTFYSFFIYPDALRSRIDEGLDTGENPRELEKEQILRLMNIIADRLYIHQYDPAVGANRLEHRVQQGESIPPGHLRAYRMGKEEILHGWLNRLLDVIENYFAFVSADRSFQKGRPVQFRLPQPLWERIDRFVRNLSEWPVWVNASLAETTFGGKQNYEYWESIFSTGKSPGGQTVLPEPMNLIRLIG